MKNNMNLTLNQYTETSFEAFVRLFKEVIDCLLAERGEKKAVARNPIPVKFIPAEKVAKPVSFRKIRKDRKDFEKLVEDFLKDFSSLPEDHQAKIEMMFFNAVDTLEKLSVPAKAELKNQDLSITFFKHFFIIHEMDKSVEFFKKSQKTMASYIYPDRRQEILSNPELYQELVDTWSGVPDDED